VHLVRRCFPLSSYVMCVCPLAVKPLCVTSWRIRLRRLLTRLHALPRKGLVRPPIVPQVAARGTSSRAATCGTIGRRTSLLKRKSCVRLVGGSPDAGQCVPWLSFEASSTSWHILSSRGVIGRSGPRRTRSYCAGSCFAEAAFHSTGIPRSGTPCGTFSFSEHTGFEPTTSS
jgi:hypothetical protein